MMKILSINTKGILTMLILVTLMFQGFKTENRSSLIGNEVKNFSLLNVDGHQVSLENYPQSKGFIIVFTCNHCPFAKLYPERLNTLNQKFTPLGIPLLAISSTDTVQFEDDIYTLMVQKSNNEEFNFPYLYDAKQEVAKQFKAQKTPHAFVIWKENGKWIIKYNGAIDDNGAEPDKVQNQFVTKAVESLLAGKKIKIEETKSIGCQIHIRK